MLYKFESNCNWKQSDWFLNSYVLLTLLGRFKQITLLGCFKMNCKFSRNTVDWSCSTDTCLKQKWRKGWGQPHQALDTWAGHYSLLENYITCQSSAIHYLFRSYKVVLKLLWDLSYCLPEQIIKWKWCNFFKIYLVTRFNSFIVTRYHVC